LESRVIGFAWRSMQCDSRYLPLFRRMLRGVVLVTDMGAARELVAGVLSLEVSDAGKLPFEMAVTRAGEVVHSAGWLVAGSGKDGSQQGLLTYERELHELPVQLSEHVKLIDRLNAMISKAQRAHVGRRIEQAGMDKE